MALPSNKASASTIMSGRPNSSARNSETSNPIRRSFSGNPFTKPSVLINPRGFNPNTPANSPSDFHRRNSIGKDQGDKENTKDHNLKPGRVRSPAAASKGTKNFMSPTISAASKITPSPKKKILVERNEPARTSFSFSTEKSPCRSVRFSDIVEDINSKADASLEENKTEASDDKEASLTASSISEALRCEEVLDPEVTVSSKIDSKSLPETVTDEPDCVNLDPTFKISPTSSCSWSCPILAPLDADPSLPPYDPKTNYLSPRPQFLHYRPNPRIEVYLNKDDGRRLEESFISGSFSDTDATEEAQSDYSQKESEDVSSVEILKEEEEEEEEEKEVDVSEPSPISTHLPKEEEEEEEEKEADVSKPSPISTHLPKEEETMKAKGGSKLHFFTRSKFMVLLLFKQDFDPDSNHVGLDINSVRSYKTVSLSPLGIQLAPNDTRFYMVWIQYDGGNKSLSVFMAEQMQDKQGKPQQYTVDKPNKPVLTADLDLGSLVNKNSYFGFAASTGTSDIQLNCVLRWNLTVEKLPGGDEESSSSHEGLKIGLGVGVPCLVLVLMGIAGLGYYLHKKRVAAAASGPNILGALKSLPGTPREFSFKELKSATNNFDEKHRLGQGGFGVVYKGVIPKENLQVAVKRFSRGNLKGKDDFLAELTIINRLRHKHLVRLLGWCHKNGVLLLVYEYMPNGSLDNHLFCGPESSTTLEWELRYKIISGVASALHYLHNEYDQRVVHRDLKASNIMLDSYFNARLGDFGLARALDNEKTSYAELEGVPGTMGYIAPECFHTGKATCESDVYGFGAVLLEVVCGQRPWTKIAGFQFLVDWVWWLHREGRILDAVDERLQGDEYVVEEAQRLLLLGLACSHPIAGERPKTQTIIQIISGAVAVPHVPPFKPAFVWPSTMPDSSNSNSAMANATTADSTPISMSSWRFGSGSESAGWTPHYASRESCGGAGGGYSDI